MFILCYDLEVCQILEGAGLTLMTQREHAPFIYALNSSLSAETLSQIEGRYFITNQFLY